MSLDYTVRESPKAKHVSLKISLAGNLEIVVPQGFDRTHIPAILRQKQRWIHRVTQRVMAQHSLSDACCDRPTQLDLKAIGQTWQIDYHPTPLPGVRIAEHNNSQLVLLGSTGDRTLCHIALRQWTVNHARMHLLPWLHRLSQELHLPYQQAAIRHQKTRWGSCSARQSISLNCKLLFLPTEVTHYVLIHELCHTVHLNHSKAFWRLVAECEPNYHLLDRSLRDLRYLVPRWMEDA
jgi:hypothetical protein